MKIVGVGFLTFSCGHSCVVLGPLKINWVRGSGGKKDRSVGCSRERKPSKVLGACK